MLQLKKILPRAMFYCALPHHSHVSLSVFNTLGQKVATLKTKELVLTR